MPKLINISDFWAVARARLTNILLDFIDGGALNETIMARNRGDFQGFELVQLTSRVGGSPPL